MKKVKTIAALFAALWAASCTPETTLEPDATPRGKAPMTFKAGFAATRSTLTDTNAVIWSSGDAISVFGTADTDNNLFSLTSGSDTSSAVFSGDITAGSTSYWAVYPYSAATSFDLSTETLTLTLPQTQDYTEGSFASGANPMAAVATSNSLAFKNLCGLLTFELTGNATISQILIYDVSGMPLAGTATVTFSGEMPVLTMTETNSLPVVIDCGTAGITLSTTPTTFYAVVPPRTFADGLQIIIIETSNDAMLSNVAATSVSRAGIRSLGTIDYTTEEVAYYGTANCYQYVAEASDQVGNIDTTPYLTTAGAIYTGTTAASVYGTSLLYDAESAAVIWQDNASLIKSVDFANNLITFTMAASQTGNALLGLYNSDSEVIWSYHVWVTDTAVGAVQYSNGYTLLDRNLGAAATTGTGLFYQWGRKEPFRNISNTIVAGPQSVAYAIANPTVFITANSADSWYINEYISLWGNPFGYTALPESTYMGTKTVFDPCPEGYMVAAPAVFANFSTSNFAWSGSGRTSSFASSGGWFGAAGFIVSTSGTTSGTGTLGDYWTNAPFDFYEYTGSLNHIGACVLSFSSNYVVGNDWYPAAAGASVRCMKSGE